MKINNLYMSKIDEKINQSSEIDFKSSLRLSIDFSAKFLPQLIKYSFVYSKSLLTSVDL